MTDPSPQLADVLRGFPTNWGRWGAADEIGSINHLSPAEAIRGAAAVRSGKAFPLGLELMRPGGDPAIGIRGPAKKFMSADKGFFLNGQLTAMPGNQEWSDDAMFMYLQGSSQIDALGHVWFEDQLYNGYPASSTIGGLTKNSVKPIGDHGIVGRGVLLDVARHKGVDHLGANEPITLADLEATAAAEGVTIEPHDVLLIRTGWITVIYGQGMDAAMANGEPGITAERELVDWFQRMEIPTYGSDSVASEQSFSMGVALPLHGALLRNLGIPIMELLWFEDLAADCAADGQYTFLFMCSPLRIHGGTGSPINPLAVK